MKTYRLAKPSITKEETQAVLRVLRSGDLALGPVHRKFEKAFAKEIGTKYAVAVSSGTAGLHLAMLAAGIGVGDEVITSPFSFIASSNSILYVGAKPVFVDIDSVTYNLDPKRVEKAITKRTKAILVVHIFGQTADMAPIMKIAKKYKLKVVEDACEAIGATYRGHQAGTFGDSAVFAFYPNKQMTTAEGGMIVTNQKKIYELCQSLRNQGRSSRSGWLEHERLGYNYRLNEISAALGLAQLKRLKFFLDQRRQIAGWYGKYLGPYKDLVALPETREGNVHSWFVYVVQILPKKIGRDKLVGRLSKQGIAGKPYLPSIHLFGFYRKRFGYKKGDFPISELISSRCLALPFYPGLKEADVKYIANKLIGIIKTQ